MTQLFDLDNERSLLEFFTGEYQQLTFREKVSLIASFAAYLRGLGESLGFEVLRSVRVKRGNELKFYCDSRELRGNTAVSATALFMNKASRNEKLRFFKEYFGLSRKLKHYRAELHSLETKAVGLLAREEWQKLGRQATSGGGDFLRERRQGVLIRCVKGEEAARILERMLPDPQRLFDEGTPLPGRGLGCASVRIKIDGKAYFFKRYDDKGLVDRCVGLVKDSRGLRVWLTGWGGVIRGLPLPRPIILVEEKTGCLVGRSWLVTEYVEGTTPLMDLWPHLTVSMRSDLLVRSAILLGRMHRFGLLHGDTNWDNLLVKECDDSLQLLFVDFDCGRITALKDARAFRDIQHFVRDLMRDKNEGDAGQRDLFVAVWKRWFFPRDPLAQCFLSGFRYRNAAPG